MGVGFGIALVIIAFIREVLGSGSFWGIRITSFYAPEAYVKPAVVMVMAPGAFIVIGLIMGWMNVRKARRQRIGIRD